MARVIVTSAHNFAAIADLAGSGLENVVHHGMTDELEVHDVSQAVLDAALVTYNADPTAEDAAFATREQGRKVGRSQQQFGDDPVVQAVVEVMRIELNELRALHSLPDIAAGAMDGAIRAKIANP